MIVINTRKYSKIQEKGIAKKIGGKEVIGSGSTPFYKGDVEDDFLLVEAKRKIEPSKSMKVEREWLEKAEEQAYQMRKGNSVVCISFGDVKDNGDLQDYFILKDDYFTHLYKCSKVVDLIIEELGGLNEESSILKDDEIIELKNVIKRIIKDNI